MIITVKTSTFLGTDFTSAIIWTFCLGFFYVFDYFGLYWNFDFRHNGSLNFSGIKHLLFHILLGFVLGFLYGTVEFLSDKYLTKSLSLGKQLILKIVVDLVITVGILKLVALDSFINKFHYSTSSVTFDERFEIILLFMVFCSCLVIFLIKVANERFGKGVFAKILLGQYKTPKEEDRIFMFLDLKDSTTIAEILGHLKYSLFIQDCFYDLNTVVSKFEAEIYQYVGDEVVLTWPYAKGITNNNCVALFFEFQQCQLSRGNYYQRNYGIYPRFKAGVHGGALMIAQVGFVKKQLAFHGDVINTSARIQKQCNNYNVPLLVSEKLIKDLKIPEHLKSTCLGDVLLKGKEKQVKVYSLLL
nr:adenylate/guanylate cyclase domain-containing protein [uncultured Allomuricauda sp.]